MEKDAMVCGGCRVTDCGGRRIDRRARRNWEQGVEALGPLKELFLSYAGKYRFTDIGRSYLKHLDGKEVSFKKENNES